MSLDALLFAKAALIGLSIAAPVGPIALLIIQRSLAGGLAPGLAAGLGAATADGVYALAAGLGLVAASPLLEQVSLWVGLAGALFLGWLGLGLLRRPPSAGAAARPAGRLGVFAGTFLLTLANPLTIVSFLAVFAGLGAAAGQGGAGSVPTVVAGVFAGSLAWQWTLAGTATLLRRRLPASALAWINRGAGLVLLGFAVWLLLRLA